MLIGQISKETGLTKDTIRYYEKRGLLKVEQTASQFNNYKQYTSEHLERLELIKKTKRFGFTLNEITDLLVLIDAKKANCSLFIEKINDKISDIDRRIQELKDFKSSILLSVQDAQTECKSVTESDNCQIIALPTKA